jgi:predicted nucleic acid-binding protein
VLYDSRHDAPGDYDKPDMYPAAAIERVQQWLAVPTVNIITPGDRHADILFRFLPAVRNRGKPDDRRSPGLAGRGVSAELALTDSDFVRFAGLRWINPVI